MRIDVNLASQPYEDARQFWMRWGTALGVLSLLTLVLLALDITGWMAASKDRAAMSQKRALIADRERIEAEAQTQLNLPENRTMWSESQYLNSLIERKAFSWTRVLENLERVMPPRVHLVSISPQLDENNELALKMTVAGDSRDRAIELARRMEESHRFAQTNIIRENRFESQNGDTLSIEMAAIYIPELAHDGTPTAPASSKPVSTAKPKPAVAKKGVKR
jgi:type IV pilus assembly protein PilN